MRLEDPRYSFDAKFTPKVRGRLEIDVGVWEKSWNVATVELTSLAISTRVELEHHADTVDHHDYMAIFGDAGGNSQQPKRAKAQPSNAPTQEVPRAPRGPAPKKPLPK